MQKIDTDRFKKQLQQVKKIDTLIETKIAERKRNDEWAEYITSQDTLDKLTSYSNTINAEIDKLINLKSQIHAAIEGLDNLDEQIVLIELYFNDSSWGEIADILHYSERTVKYIHGRALQNFAQICTKLHDFAQICTN